MSNPGDPQRSQQDRGYYGAGWSQPAPPAPSAPQGPGQTGQSGQLGQLGQPYSGQPYSGQPYAGGPGPYAGGPSPYAGGPGPSAGGQAGRPRPHRATGDPRRAFEPGASVTNTAGALIAVVSIVLVEFLSGLIGLIGTSLVVHPFSSYGGSSLISGFVAGVFAAPFPFYAGAFLALAFLTPITRRSPLPTVLLRAVIAGAAGTIALALVGVFTGSIGAVRSGASRLVIDVVTSPLQHGVPFTLMLLATATAAWLWLGRPRGGRRAPGAPGTPGTVRPADAVPPPTVQPAQQPPQWQQPPSAPWGGPAPR